MVEPAVPVDVGNASVTLPQGAFREAVREAMQTPMMAATSNDTAAFEEMTRGRPVHRGRPHHRGRRGRRYRRRRGQQTVDAELPQEAGHDAGLGTADNSVGGELPQEAGHNAGLADSDAKAPTAATAATANQGSAETKLSKADIDAIVAAMALIMPAVYIDKEDINALMKAVVMAESLNKTHATIARADVENLVHQVNAIAKVAADRSRAPTFALVARAQVEELIRHLAQQVRDTIVDKVKGAVKEAFDAAIQDLLNAAHDANASDADASDADASDTDAPDTDASDADASDADASDADASDADASDDGDGSDASNLPAAVATGTRASDDGVNDDADITAGEGSVSNTIHAPAPSMMEIQLGALRRAAILGIAFGHNYDETDSALDENSEMSTSSGRARSPSVELDNQPRWTYLF